MRRILEKVLGMARTRFVRAMLTIVAICAISLFIAVLMPITPSRYLDVEASGEISDRFGKLMYAFLNNEQQWAFPRPLNEISPYLIQATIATEDERFYSHHGVDPIAVLRAVGQDLWALDVRSGASTLTMQVVKERAGSSRSLLGKLAQAIYALRLERVATKQQILDAYLNSAPYGLNLVGCESAARRYFGKPANELTLSEGALLAGLPKAPVALMPLNHPAAALQRRNYVLDRMLETGAITKAQHDAARVETMGVKWHEFPQLSPHLAMQWRGDGSVRGSVATTLNYALQVRCESNAREWLKTFDNTITNAAILVIDTRTASVLARVGAVDFYGTPGGGQVDACRAARSPGSALKPFTYALGMERNLLYPSEILLDDSLDYGLYSPENFDQNYRGLVSAGYALRRSLNIPAVTVLERIGMQPMYAFLQKAGVRTLTRDADYYGLGLTLGNCEVRLDELAAAYCMLANLGDYRPLRYHLSEPTSPPRRLLSRGTCLALYEMMEQPLPDEFQKDIVSAAGLSTRVCWKTGTSTGLHDAWSFVFNQEYVVAVWLGNNDGHSSKTLVGARAALPLAARIFRSLPHTGKAFWPDAGTDLRDITVCAETGLPATNWCARTTYARIPAGEFVNRACDVHYPATGSGATFADAKTMERWPAEARGWDLANVNATPPALQNEIRPAMGVTELKIAQPANKAEFILTQESNADRVKVRASLDDTTALNWYLDAKYLGISGPSKSLFVVLTPGEHRLTCMTPGGSTDTVAFTVSLPEANASYRTR